MKTCRIQEFLAAVVLDLAEVVAAGYAEQLDSARGTEGVPEDGRDGSASVSGDSPADGSAMPTFPPDAGVTRDEVITVYLDSSWGDLMVSFSDAKRRCIQDSVGDDFERVMTLPVLSDGDAQQHEVAVFGCLSKDKAGGLFVAMLKADYPKLVGASAEFCLTELMARTDLADVYRRQMRMDGNGDDAVVAGFSADVVECLGHPSLDDDVPAPSQ